MPEPEPEPRLLEPSEAVVELELALAAVPSWAAGLAGASPCPFVVVVAFAVASWVVALAFVAVVPFLYYSSLAVAAVWALWVLMLMSPLQHPPLRSV